MNGEELILWKLLGVNSEAVNRESKVNQELLGSLQSHFYVSSPFRLDKDLHVDQIANIGTLEKQPKQEVKNILTVFIEESDKDFGVFSGHQSKAYTLETIPTSINVMDIKNFLPIVDGFIDGYYKVEKVYFTTFEGDFSLRLNFSTFIPLGEKKVQIDRSKMQPGELISFELMERLYEDE